MTPAEIATAKALCNHAVTNETVWAHAAEVTGALLWALAEIERLQDASRWRDPAVELPEDNRPVIVALRRIEGLWPPIPAPPIIAECEGSSWWVDDEEIRDVRAWRPLPDPPEVQA